MSPFVAKFSAYTITMVPLCFLADETYRVIAASQHRRPATRRTTTQLSTRLTGSQQGEHTGVERAQQQPTQPQPTDPILPAAAPSTPARRVAPHITTSLEGLGSGVKEWNHTGTGTENGSSRTRTSITEPRTTRTTRKSSSSSRVLGAPPFFRLEDGLKG
jgi:hypothetical protein